MTIVSLAVVNDRSFIDTSFFRFAANLVGALIPLIKVLALLSSRVRLKLATGRVYFPLS
jgi:hypothetical protein